MSDNPKAISPDNDWECIAITEVCLRIEEGKQALVRFILDECFLWAENQDHCVERLTMNDAGIAEVEEHFGDTFDRVHMAVLRAAGLRGALFAAQVFADNSVPDRVVKVLDSEGTEKLFVR